MKTIGIIPARFSSTRFPGKPLAMIGDKSMIQRVFTRAKQSSLDQVIIATDSNKIKKHVESFGGKAQLTSEDHQTGTERCEEVSSSLDNEYDVVINIQGDEPFIEPYQINLIIDSFEDNRVDISTLIEKFSNLDDILSPGTAKVVKDNNSFAVFFSRSIIPFPHNIKQDRWLEDCVFYNHVGIYGYRTKVLKEIVKLPANNIELTESLEQLRWLLNGYRIKVIETQYNGIQVDTPADLERAREFLNNL